MGHSSTEAIDGRTLTDHRALAHLDQLLAVWEWRSGATPWLVMRARGVAAVSP